MSPPELEHFLEAHSSPEDSLLLELNRATHLKQQYPQMLTGTLQGRLLQMISQMIRPMNILEIGTFTGYSAICLASGLQQHGQLHTIEIDEELIDFAGKYFRKAGIAGQITQHCGNALDIIPGLNIEWDLVFLDADKENYLNYYQMIVEQTKPGGFILADNVLWDGKAMNPPENPDKETRGIIAFNTFVNTDQRVEQIILPLRDGLMLIRKK